MKRIARIAGQVAAFAAFAAVVGWLSSKPDYRRYDPSVALVTVSFSHTGPRVSECRRRTPEEIAELAANMRRAEDCPRGRLPVVVSIDVDGSPVYDEALPPHGIADDGSSTAYRAFTVKAGEHVITARLRDTRRVEGFDHVRTDRVTLAAGQHFTIDFRPEAGGFVFR